MTPGRWNKPTWTDRRLLKFIGGALVVALVCLWALCTTGCGYAEHRDPPVFTFDSPALVSESARLHAKDAGGRVFTVTCCGSMLPLIRNGDLVVVVRGEFSDALLGRPVCYVPKWAKGGNIVHRLVSGDAREGFIASGDNVPRSENWERVTAANYLGEVVGIYRVSP